MMRSIAICFAVSLMVVASGCDSGWRSKDELGRRIYVKWPKPPTEMGGTPGNYVATLADKRPDGLYFFSASIQEHGEGMTEEEAAKVVDVIVGLLGEDLKRKTIEFGSKKFPGLDVMHRGRNGEFVRTIVVRSKTRRYTIGASAPTEDALSNRDVVKFFDSLKIDG